MEPARGVLVAVGGRVASGKSTLARQLAERLGAEHVEADRVRQELFGEGSLRSLAPDVEKRVYDELGRRAEAALRAGRAVVMDACFARARERAAARDLARRGAVPFRFVECRAAGETVRRRLADREGEGWAEIAEDLARQWEPVRGLAASAHVVIESDAPLVPGDARIEALVAGLAAEAGPPAPLALPRAVTFDCWNTLLYEEDWGRARELRVEALALAAAEAGREVDALAAGRAFDAAWDLHIRLWRAGQATTARDVALAALAGLGLREPHPSLERLVRQWEEASHSSAVCALPGARETLAALARRGVRCALVCDTGLTPGRVVRQHLERLGLLEFLEAQAFSGEVGVPKPNARMFRAALDPLGVAPEEALHVGDLRATDVAGAQALGMAAVRIRALHDDASELPDAPFVVDSHAELVALLGVAPP